jgi:hypothetical protein
MLRQAVPFALCLACATPRGALEGGGRGLAFAVPAPGERSVDADRNADGRPDLFEVRAPDESNPDGRLVRRAQDLDFDGRLDVVELYDLKGQRTEEAFDLDFDGRTDVTVRYEHGELVRKELSHGTDGATDVVQFYEKNNIVRVERDTDRNGRVDLWEYWEDGRIDRIGEDVDGDGEVDRWTRQAKTPTK